MFLKIITTKIKALVFFFLSLIRRALCCFRRRRRPSTDGVPLTHVGVVSSNSAKSPNEEWTDWNVAFNEAKPNTVQDHIEVYRKQLAAARQAREEETQQQEQDLFGDMTPRITKQKKVFVDHSQQSEQINSNRLSLEPDALGVVSVVEGGLGEWEENSGWEGETMDWSVKVALHEKKKQERERKLWEQQQKRLERSNRPVSLGARVSS